MGDQPGDSIEVLQEDPKTPKNPSKGSTSKGTVPKKIPEEQIPKDRAYDIKRTGPAAIHPENLLDVTRKWKAADQPKPSTTGGALTQKRKKTTKSRWLPQTQPHTTYVVRDKVFPAWGFVSKGSIDQAENWRVQIYIPPKFTDKQEEAKKKTKKE